MNTGKTKERADDGTQSIGRAITLLARLSKVNREGGSVAELAAETGMNRTTAHRILRSMAEAGLLRYAAESHRYFLGPMAYEVGMAAAEQVKLRRICAQALARLAQQTGDTVFLMERERFDSVCIDRAEGSYPVKTLLMSVGDRRPLGVGAGALAILAALPDPEEAILFNADRISDYPGMTLQRVRQELSRARSHGFVSTSAVGVSGARAIALPLRTREGRPIGAVSIAAVDQRMGKQRQAELLEILQRETASMTDALSSI